MATQVPVAVVPPGIYSGPTGQALVVTQQAGATYTFALADAGTVVESTNATGATFTIPLNSSVAFGVPTEITALDGPGSGVLTVTGAAGVTLNGVSGGSVATTGAYQAITLIQTAANTWVGTTGSAGGLSNPVTIPEGGTGATTAAAALSSLGAVGTQVAAPTGVAATDTANIQAALNGTGTFYLATGAYICNPLSAPGFAHLVGVNSENNGFGVSNGTMIKANPAHTFSGPFIDFPAHASGQIFEHLVVDVTAVATGITYALYLDDYSTGGGEEWQGQINDVFVDAGSTAAGTIYVGNNRRAGDFRRIYCNGGVGAKIYGTDSNWWNCSFADSSVYGVQVQANTTNMFGCRAFGNGYAGVLTNGQLQWFGGSIDTNPRGVYTTGTWPVGFSQTTFTNNTNDDIECHGTGPISLSQCIFEQGSNIPNYNIVNPVGGPMVVEQDSVLVGTAYNTAHAQNRSATVTTAATLQVNIVNQLLGTSADAIVITMPAAYDDAWCGLDITQPASSTAATVTWPATSVVVWPGAIAPTLTATNGKTDSFVFYWNSTRALWLGYVVALNS